MKKLFLLVVFVALGAMTYAQSFSFGPTVSISMTNLSVAGLGGRPISNEPRPGVSVGMFVKYRTPGIFALQAEVQYATQGSRFKFDDATQSGNLRLGYINVPVLMKFYIVDGLNIEVGPQVGFLLDSKFKEASKIFRAGTEFRKVDFSVDAGVGYDFPIGFNLGIRYNIGMLDAIKSYEGESRLSKNGVFQMIGSWEF